jgi:hypothetical protein
MDQGSFRKFASSVRGRGTALVVRPVRCTDAEPRRAPDERFRGIIKRRPDPAMTQGTGPGICEVVIALHSI